MALFQKKPITDSSVPAYTIGSTKTVLIIGLGNPGKEYESTRHNIGFAVLNAFTHQNNFPGWVQKKDLKCQLAIATLGESRVILCKPTTFMNNSGEAAHAVQRFYRVYNPQTLAVYDELAIPFGQVRTRLAGSDAGHNGVKSLIQHIGDDFYRLRIGIGNDVSDKADAADFVLGKFSKSEQSAVGSILDEATGLISEFIFSGGLEPQARKVL